MKVCIDAGHMGKYNKSPVVPEYYESDMNWKLHLLLKKYLEEYGIEVVLTRSDKDKDLEVSNRGKKAKGCDLLLSIHSNACDTESVDRPVVIVPINGTGDEIGEKLANCIAEVMETKQKAQVKTKKGNRGDYFGVIRGAVSVGVPGLILEHSFHTNKRATKWLLIDSNLDKLASAEADVIAKHYGIEKPKLENDQKGMVDVKVSVLKKGAKGDQVKALQALLIGYGYSCGSKGVDGSFGGDTDKAVRAYQKDKGLADDGSVGSKTWNKLLGN